MKQITSNLDKLKEEDIYSFILFALFQIKELPEYSTLSELIYLLDRKSVIKLCEYYGGLTIKIPTIDELELLVSALLMYQYVNIEGKSFEEAETLLQLDSKKSQVAELYDDFQELLAQYTIHPRTTNHD